jgi:predicted double-glycine peptidase
MKRFTLPFLVLLAIAGRAHAAPDDIVLQSTSSDCGPAALATLLKVYLDVPTSEAEMVKLTGSKPQFGTTLMQLEQAANGKGCQADSYRMNWKTLKEQIKATPLPLIVRTLNPEPHFSLLLAIDGDTVFIADPAIGHIMLSERAFLKRWLVPGYETGYAFMAIGPEGTVDGERRSHILDRLTKQRQSLQAMQLHSPVFRR